MADIDEPKQGKDETAHAFRRRYAEWKGLGCRKKGSAKATNLKKATGVCLVCGLNRLECICSGHMSQAAHERFAKEQKTIPTPKQSGFGKAV